MTIVVVGIGYEGASKTLIVKIYKYMIHSGIEANYTLPDDTYFFEAMPLKALAVLGLFNCKS